MAKAKEISYRKVRNLGNYESEALEIRLDLDEKDNVVEKVNQLKKLVSKLLGCPDKSKDPVD